MSAKTAPPRGQPISCNVSEPPDRVGHAARTASRVAKATAALQLLSRRAHAARQRVPIAHAIHPVAGTAMSMSVAAVGASHHLSVTVRRRAPQRRMARSSSSRPAAAHGTTPAPPIRATPPRMHGPRPRHPTTARADEPPVRQLAAARIPPRKRKTSQTWKAAAIVRLVAGFAVDFPPVSRNLPARWSVSGAREEVADPTRVGDRNQPRQTSSAQV